MIFLVASQTAIILVLLYCCWLNGRTIARYRRLLTESQWTLEDILSTEAHL